MTGDSSAETQAEESGQTATMAPDAATSVQPEAGVREDAERHAALGEPGAQPASNGSADADRQDEATGQGETNGNAQPPAAASDRPPLTITPDVEKPAFGPRILGIAEPVKPLAPSKSAPARKRRRRPSAAERHRRAFFSALTELRRSAKASSDAPAVGEAAGAEADSAPAVKTPQVEEMPVAAEPVPAAPDAPAAQAPAAPEGPAAQAASSADAAALLTGAIERVGGEEIIKEALKPKQDEKGQPLKWAAVCAKAAEGLKPGDPLFDAWVRLAATPVREVKAHLPRPAEQARPAAREGGRRNGGQRSSEGGRRDRPRREDRTSRQAFASHAQDGTLRKSIRIVTGRDEEQERRERERVRKEQREAKRLAERERLARLGY